ncbi:MAG: DUF6017 domain-containing protein [Lachnospiraceae bacterium]|nr:DUF6017 domain-containing protein [Lachnospiraceae bacterium]
MKNWGAFFDLINPDNTMSFNRLFAHSIGTVETIIYFSLISKCKYWDNRGMLIDDEWFYSTVDDLQESTAIARRQQENAISKLVDIGLIKCERKGIPAKRCFNIIYDPELICSVIEEGKANIEKLRSKNSEKATKSTLNISFTNSAANGLESSSHQTYQQESVNNFLTNSAANGLESSSHQTYQQEGTKRTNKDVPNVPTINNLNKNNLNKNNLLSYQSINEPERIVSEGTKKIDRIDENRISEYKSLIHSNIDYAELIEQNLKDKQKIDEIVDNMLEMMCCPSPTMRLGGTEQPTALVQGRIMKIDSTCIEYILLCLQRNTTKVHNIKAYLQTVIFNAPSTMDNYFDSEVNNALYGSSGE